jgi:hypothetical protein
LDHINTHLAARRTSLAQPSTSSIEVSVSNTNNTSIELPAEILALIDNKAYLNRHKKLYRLYPRELMELARIAMTKPKPSHWYATATRKTSDEGHEDHFVAVTLKWVRETVLSVQQTAARVAAKLRTDVTRFIYRQVWRGANVERWADAAAEVGRNKSAYFAWLCRREVEARAGGIV